MLDIAVKEIMARKVRSALCVAGVMVCVFLITTVQGLTNMLGDTLAGDVARLDGTMYFQQKGAPYPPYGSSFQQQVGDQVLAFDGVDEAASTPILFVVIEPADNPRDTANVLGVALTPGKERAFLGDAVIASGNATLADQPENAAILGSGAADFYQARVGETITIRERAFLVTGVLKKRGTANTDNAIILSLPYGQAVFGRNGMISAVIVSAAGKTDPATVELSLEEKHANWEVQTQAEIEEELVAALKTPRSMLGMINAVVFVVTIIIIMNVMMMTVKEKTREIGTMRAIGTGRGTVLRLIFYESLILSVVGGGLGLAAAIPASFMLAIPITGTLLKPIVLAQVAVLIFLTGVFSGLLPGYAVTRTSPLEALRYE